MLLYPDSLPRRYLPVQATRPTSMLSFSSYLFSIYFFRLVSIHQIFKVSSLSYKSVNADVDYIQNHNRPIHLNFPTTIM